MKRIKLANNKGFSLIDDEDFEEVSKYKWHNARGYAECKRVGIRSNGKRGICNIFIHHLIIGKKEGMHVDHINRNKLDNRRKNLRHCTISENVINTGLNSRNKTGYKGVYWEQAKRRFRAVICFQRKYHRLGIFKTAEEAALAYNKKARELHGKYAHQNVIRKLEALSNK